VSEQDDIERLGQVVVKRYGTGRENPRETAEIVAICDAPSFILVTTEGERYNWRQDLTRPATEAETINYWKRRAESAERTLKECVASRKDGEG
jgi:hypothetical protein